MLWPLIVLLVVPLAALGWISWSRRPHGAEWKPYVIHVGILFATGLFAAGPFVTTRSLGTSEAYNYSLAVADAVTQARAGVIPTLVGQSEFAFNGRIHPVRTAPYLTTLAQALDLATFRQLNFWALQNLALALSLVAAAFSCYQCLRRSTEASSQLSLVFTAAYLLSPGVLAAAYAMDLYMTVMAVPYVPLVVAANLRALDGRRGFGTYLLLACGLAACWWAHPPVAWWLSLASVLAHLPLLFALRLRSREMKAIIPAVAIGMILAGFVFTSALSVRSYSSMSAARAPEAVVKEILGAFHSSLLPVSAAANKLGDFQLGYSYWALLGLAWVFSVLRRSFASLVLVTVALALLAFTIPVPLLTAWLWDHMPTFAITINGPWPMQRLYPIITALFLFGAARIRNWPRFDGVPKVLRDLTALALIVVSFWTVYQSWRFISRGYASRADTAYTRYSHAPENINLTLIAYAMFTLPPSFENGVMDPVMETRVLKRETADELVSNWKASEAWGREVQTGRLTASSGSGDIAELKPTIKLEPGRRYILDLTFRSPPLTGVLRIIGPNTIRVYPLPQAGQPRGFGMEPSNRHSLTLWTSSPETEIIQFQLIGPEMGSARLLNFADFKLRELDPEKLPIRVESLVPFRATVRVSEPGYIEIPRIFIDGYRAMVDGHTSRVQRSPDGLVMASVPGGESKVEIRYDGPWWLRISFWSSCVGWCAVIILCGVFTFLPRSLERGQQVLDGATRTIWKQKLPIIAACLVLAASSWGWHAWRTYAQAAGPLRLRVVLPRENVGRSQPLLTTGIPQAATFIFVIYQDPTHIRVGMDIWGRGMYWASQPIEADYFAEHEFVISTGALYPLGHPKLSGKDPAPIERLRNRITVQFDGKTVLDQPVFSFDSSLRDVTIGLNRIQGSSAEPSFFGQILETERLPIPDSVPPLPPPSR
ncbi:hypothetical protein DB347_14865 [Opitutaceae bacterium EW11]|nr:hypothetical protein DB347_14865 [Opitutaceae bacterium EW11]